MGEPTTAVQPKACPTCGGRGRYWETPFNGEAETREVICWRCAGSGIETSQTMGDARHE
jgi:DnaJ-class molecular chaperone